MVEMIDMDEIMATVKGFNSRKNPVKFDMTRREIKHIRRCVGLYLHIHPKLKKEPKNLSEIIYDKFKKFGKMKRRVHVKKRMKDKQYICTHKGCKIKKNLTIDHIRPLSADGSNKSENLRWLCSEHHQTREIDYILKRKILEVKKLEDKKEMLLKEALKKNKEDKKDG